MKSGLPAWRPLARACTSWVLALMLLVSLLPAVSRAMGAMDAPPGADASATRAGWVEICSSSGMRWVQLNADADPGEPASNEPMADGSRHCPWCNLGSGTAGLPPEPAAWGLLEVREARPRVMFGLPTPEAHRFSAQPRAPPLA